MKFVYKLLFIFLLSLFVNNTLKAETYFTNELGTEFTKKEYDFVSEMFWDGYQNNMTLKELNEMRESNALNGKITKKRFLINDNDVKSLNNGGRVLSMNSSCGNTCLITINATWNVNPSIKSYDVIGFRTTGVPLTNTNSAFVSGTNYSMSYSYNKSASNGRGYSIKFPNTSNVIISASMYTTTGGTIYGSYQHAKSNISLDNSKLYTFSANGSGNTFLFYGAAFGKYDNINGLSISV